MQKAIGYIRVSTEDQAENGVSMDAQRAKIEAWCLLNDYQLEAVYTDAGISGKSTRNREGLQQARKHAGKGDALVAYSLSRISRSTQDMLAIAADLERSGTDLVSLSERIDTTSASGKMVFRMLAVLNEFERDLVSERTRSALTHKRLKGEVYSPVPFGFKAVEGRLMEVESEARLIREMMAQRDEGWTLRRIADELNTRGIRGKRNGKWHASTVRYLLNRKAAA